LDYIGIDLGTSSVKILMMNEKGKERGTVSKPYPVFHPNPGWSEQNPSDWMEKTMEGIRELLEKVDGKDVRGISFAGQMHGLVVLDNKDQVIRPAILWNDGRSIKESEYLNQKIGKEILSKHTMNISFPGFTASKILWMKENEPENFRKISKIMLPKDYLIYRFTGIHATDVTDASGTLLFDVKNRCWSEEMVKICGICSSLLPKVYESYEKTGCLKKEVAEAIGLKPEVFVAAGSGDNAAAAVGTGTAIPGACNISVGTSGTIFALLEEPKTVEDNALHMFAHGDGKWHILGCMLSAASSYNWWAGQILREKDFTMSQKGISRLGQNDVFFLPYLMGERAPYNDADARGVFIGMHMDTTREDMTQAVLEGVAFGLRDSLEIVRKMGLRVSTASVCGGGAGSVLWRKILSCILNVELEILDNEEGPALGAAIFAAVAGDAFSSVREASEYVKKVKERVFPDPELVLQYEKKYKQYKRLYPALKEVFKEEE
jgi:xylulokinase